MNIYIRAMSAILLVAALAACAATAPNVTPNAAEPRAVAGNFSCQTQTGSRTAVDSVNCLGIRRSYSSDDLIRTGATTVAEALPLLDPTITIHH
jgi:hypothetical protein